MKIQSMPLMGLLLSAVLFFSDSYGYETIKDKLTISPQCTGEVIDSEIESGFLSTMPEIIALDRPEGNGISDENNFLDFLKSLISSSTSGGAKAISVEGEVNSNVSLISDHNYYLRNNDNEPRQFTVKTKLSTHDHQFAEHEHVFILEPKEYLRGSKKLVLNKKYSAQGAYTIYPSIAITSSGSATAVSNIATVTIR